MRFRANSPLDVPLQERRVLIEASAGSGKTRAITTLVARQIVEADCRIENLLVVTFTRAATDELRKRIRSILKQVYDQLAPGAEADGEEPSGNGETRRSSPGGRFGHEAPAEAAAGSEQARELLDFWLARKRLERKDVSARIDQALLDIDLANICTIHGFCQQALGEFAFESGFPFGIEVVGNGAEIIESVVRDLWQRELRACSATFADFVMAEKFLPDELARWIGRQRSRPVTKVRGVAKALATPAEAEQPLRTALDEVRKLWGEHGEAAREFATGDSLHKHSYGPVRASGWLAEIEAAARKDRLPSDVSALATATQKLSREKLEQSCKKHFQVPENPLFEAFDAVHDACQQLKADYGDWLAASRWRLWQQFCGEISRVVRDTRQLTYDDLLAEMHAALSGPAGERLASELRQRFPVALIDEFQDTDRLQAAIFERIYDRPAADDSSQAEKHGSLLIVGDPKQSIYQFRGADVFAYLDQQRQDSFEVLLERNWRSAPRLVYTVNAVFDMPLAFAVPEIAFQSAVPGRDSAGALQVDDGEATPFSFWLLDEQKNNETAVRAAAEATAEDIAHLLEQARAGRAKVEGRPLRAADIAVLVPENQLGRRVADALHERGCRCISSDKSNVFGSREAAELQRLLSALANAGRHDHLRTALGCELLGLTNEELLELRERDEAWGEWSSRFENWRATWQFRGVGAMLRQIIDSGSGHLLRYADGPRRLTNARHLAELLQNAESESRLQPAELLHWLERRRLEAKSGHREAGESTILRIESDEDLVKIMTIHGSKGLEFPIVYLPFAWHSKQLQAKRSGEPASYHEREGGKLCATLDFAPETTHARDMERMEAFGESLRRLYVALTRASERCVVVWTRVNSRGEKELPPLVWLLHGDPANRQPLEQLAGTGRHLDAGPAVPDDVRDVYESCKGEFQEKSWNTLCDDIQALVDRCPDGSAGIRDLGAADSGDSPEEEPGVGIASQFEGLGADTEAKQHKCLGEDLACRHFDRSLRRIRQMTSFTALTAIQVRPDGETAARDHDEGEPASGPDAQPTEWQAQANHAFDFPRGIRTGTCMHRIFELLDTGGADAQDIGKLCATQLERSGIDSRWNDAACAMIENARATILQAPGRKGFRLDRIARRLVELEFCFPVDGFRRETLDATLERHGCADRLGDEPGSDAITGFMRGFIDLVVEHDGCWYVLDYKSNWLGDQAGDYRRECLDAAMSEHRYHLQYLIYLLALHRYLRQRLPDYDYERHIGGVFYLFLRGMAPAAGMSRGVFFDRPSRQCIEELDDCMGGKSQ